MGDFQIVRGRGSRKVIGEMIKKDLEVNRFFINMIYTTIELFDLCN